MKKLLLISLVLVGIAGLANASPIFCSVLMNPNTSGNTGSTCTINPDLGFFISSLTLTGTDDYTGLQGGTPTVTFTGSLNQSSAVFTGLTFCDVTTGGSGSTPCSDPVTPSSTVTGLNLATYSVNLAGVSNTVSGGVVTGASVVLSLDYAETQIPSSGVPEPATLSLMGFGLLGLGFLARKGKKLRSGN